MGYLAHKKHAPLHCMNESKRGGEGGARGRSLAFRLQRCGVRFRGWGSGFWVYCWKTDVQRPGRGDSNSHGARPVCLIITMIEWIRTSKLSMTYSLSGDQSSGCLARGKGARKRGAFLLAPCTEAAQEQQPPLVYTKTPVPKLQGAGGRERRREREGERERESEREGTV